MPPRGLTGGDLADGHAFELEPRVPSWPPLGLLSLAPGDPHVQGHSWAYPDDNRRKPSSSPSPGNWGPRPEEMRIKPKAKAGASPSEAMKAVLGASFLTVSSIRLVGDSWRKKTVNSGFSALELEGGSGATRAENEGMLHPPLTPIGIEEQGLLPPGVFLSALKGWLGLHMEVAPGVPALVLCHRCGGNGRAQTCDVYIFKGREEHSVGFGVGLGEEGLTPCLRRQPPPPGFGFTRAPSPS